MYTYEEKDIACKGMLKMVKYLRSLCEVCSKIEIKRKTYFLHCSTAGRKHAIFPD